MNREYTFRMRKIGFFPLLAVIMIGLASYPASAVNATADPGLTGNFTDAVDLWYSGAPSYRKAGLNIENPNNVVKLITGIQMTFNLSDAPGYAGKVMVQRRTLDDRDDASIEHDITGFQFGNERTQNFLFSEDEYLIVDDDYNIQFRPTKPQHLALQCLDGDEEEDNSFFWDPKTGDWATTAPTDPTSPNIAGKEWAMSALAEPATRLSKDMPSQNPFSSPDMVDGFYVNLDMDKTYVFFLEHSPTTNFKMYLYKDRDINGIPGKLNADTLVTSSSDSGGQKKITVTAKYTGRYYVLVKPQQGTTGGIYELKFTENRNPVVEAGEDVYANMRLGKTIAVKFENTASYDPDDDLNNNKEIDQSEKDNLEYYWDFDASNDVPGDFADWAKKGWSVTETFSKGGKYTVTLAVVDPYGASATDTFDLYLNYIPVVKMKIDGLVEGIAYVEQKLTFSAEGSYDPDDDTNGNGIIDGSETDQLTYSWDFYDKIDKNMDGNYSNDTDASNKMWLMKYTKPGEYRVMLNVWDNPEPADRAYNSTHLDITLIDPVDIMKYFGVEDDDTVVHDEDGSTSPYDGVTTADDVAVRKMTGSEDKKYSMGGKSVINIDFISAEKDGNYLKLTLTTEGKILAEKGDAAAIYSIYIVEAEADKQFSEPQITTDNFENLMIEYLYCFSFSHGVLTGVSTLDEEIAFNLNVTFDDDGYTLVIRIPAQELKSIEDEIQLDDDELIDIFAVTTYTVTQNIQGETVQEYCRDACGLHPSALPIEFWPVPIGSLDSDGDGINDVIEDKNGNGIVDPGETDPFNPDTDGDGILDGMNNDPLLTSEEKIDFRLILIIIAICSIFTILVLVIYTRLKRKMILENETRNTIYAYINRNPGAHYTKIKENLGISDSTLTHHIRKLRETEMIKIKYSGNFKFFYPLWMKDVPSPMTPIQKSILDLIRKKPGSTTQYLAMELGKKSRTIRYHLNNIADKGLINSKNIGNRTHWFETKGTMREYASGEGLT